MTIVMLFSVTFWMPLHTTTLKANTEDKFKALPEDELDFDEMRMSFDEPFNTLDVSAWGPNTRWIAHTPWSGDFGGAAFADPEDGFPFTIEDGQLRIEATMDVSRKWRSGLLASTDSDGNGFSQQYGYFEIRARLPVGAGVWPAFWLIGIDRSKYTAEVDVLEYYGDKPDGYSTVVHVWHRDGEHYSDYDRIQVFPEYDPTEYNTYGVKIDQSFIRIYFNRQMVWRTPTPEEHYQPMYMLLNLALIDNATKDGTPNPSFMFVDYVKAFTLSQD
ncbi:glycoside hydrolase family 16 protein [Ahrensia sp. 13_GOM-1096m]|uniref:glycoside hydrolase family 16 protein n=1 Tax=Ahrensia sp. 13_GOM-1096m TaxID=1380380 RepID=UPI00192E5D5C|nr:glycoside hydrolase family 16 protein [Ahrensia sp. 13_GOM-1096m]